MDQYRGFAARLRRQFRRRRLFADTRSWLTDAYVRLLNCRPGFLPSWQNKDFRLRPRHWRLPVLVRAHTADMSVITELFDWDIYRPALQIVPGAAGKILDLGGNIGLSVRLWQEYFPEAFIVVVEPDPGNFKQLLKNIQAGPAPGKVHAIRAFAAAEPGEAFLDRSGDEVRFRMTHVQEESGDAQKIPKRTVAGLLTLLAGADGSIDLLKCDVEGTEAEIFHNCRPWIDRISRAAIETHYPYNSEKLFNDLRLAGAKIAAGCVKDFSVTRPGEATSLVFLRLEKSNSQAHPGEILTAG